MRLDDLLRVMRDEFAQAANDIDTQLLTWCSEGAPGGAAASASVLLELQRVVQTARVIALEGLGLALEALYGQVQFLAAGDEAQQGQGLGWLIGWRAPFEACFAAPGNAEAAQRLLDFLSQGPLPPHAEDAAQLLTLLVSQVQMPAAALEENLRLPDATEADVALDVPEDIDRDLYETFLADAPMQAARLAEAVALLVRAELPPAQVLEAQRVAHTFKGSGNIVGVRGVGRLAHRIEDLIEFAAEHREPLPRPMAQDLEQATATLEQMLGALRGEEAAPTDALQRLQALLDWVNAIRTDTWQALAAQRAGACDGLPQAAPTPAAPQAPMADPPVAPPASTAVASSPGLAPEAQAQLRVDVRQLDRLVRRAGQDLVRGARITEHLQSLDERLRALQDNQRALQQRLAELQTAVDRQGVSLSQKSEADGGGFDPLEMDRYNQLHTLSRFVAEGVADETELCAAARAEAAAAAVALREHGLSLKDQYHELIATRMVPFQRSVARLRRTVMQTAAVLGKQVRLQVQGDQVQLDSDVLERLTEPLLHLLRNAVDHGLETPDDRLLLGKAAEGTVTIQVRRQGHMVQVDCADDGQGIGLPAVHARAVELGLLAADAEVDADSVARLILLPGFSTRDEVTEVSGRGVGLDVVAERVRTMKGTLDIRSQALAGTTISLRVPATLGAVHALVVEAGGALFALATDTVLSAVAAGAGSHAQSETEGLQFSHGARHYPAFRLADWVGLADTGTPDDERPVVLVRGAGRTVAVTVDRVVETRELVLQDTGVLLRRARGVVASAFRSNGRVMFVLDPDALDRSNRGPVSAQAAAELQRRAQAKRQHVLVVDDAISVRKAVMQLLQDSGFEVTGARDGFDALQQLQRRPADLVLTDLEMPKLNGLDFTRLLRQQDSASRVPVVMITSRATQKHRDAALAAGVDLYLTKPYTDADLLAHVRRLLAA